MSSGLSAGYNWVRVRLVAIDDTEMRALVIDAWAMVVPKAVVAAYVDEHAAGKSPSTPRRRGRSRV